MKRFERLVVVLAVVWVGLDSAGQTRLPALISDGMVLQRESDLRIWGWDNAGQAISVSMPDRTYETVTNDKGNWEVLVAPLTAGGPFIITVSGSSEIKISDVLVGDVWVCSGQSNMELNMRRASPLYGKEIDDSENDSIRYFAAPQSYNFNERLTDYGSGKWQKANPESVLNFGAIAYFFAKELNNKYSVPIGIINTAIGGSPTEAWISEEAIRAFPIHYSELQRFKDKSLIGRIEKENREKPLEWYSELGKKDQGHLDPKGKWTYPDVMTTGWQIMKIPGYWAQTKLGPVNGAVWFRKIIDVPASMAGKQAKLLLGRIVDADSVFINGDFVGTTGYQYPPRRYEVPAGLLYQGKNSIVVKVINNGGLGGFVPDKPYMLIAGEDTIELKGEWHFALGAEMKPLDGGITIKYKPSGLYNAMIGPLINYRIKGILWYQGESNTERPAEQKQLFPALINDWRRNWNQGDLPFLYVQLPNYMSPAKSPTESNWALFREAQLAALALRNTAMAVTIDVGEWNDIHPLNKLDVAHRLALAARKVAYGEDIVYSGPIFKSMKIKGNRAVLSFTHTGSGLMLCDDNVLKRFAIAGFDRKFVWADAVIKNNKVLVSHPEILNPVAVRYSWADNPEGANLCNREGLPASPFRTDSW